MLGKEIKEFGVFHNSTELMGVHLHLPQGGQIKPHNHPGQDIFFTVVKGEIEVSLNDEEKHLLTPGIVLNFAGEAYISGIGNQESEAFIYLINRR